MKKYFLTLLSLISLTVFANEDVIRCSLRANYEIYKGEGLVERSEGSLIAVPVEFSFFTNDQEFSATLTGGKTVLRVKAKAGESEGVIELSGGALPGASGFQSAFSISPKRGTEQVIDRDQLSPFTYSGDAGRVVFSRAVLKCAPSVRWDSRPVNP
jgi:hypothetical protein